MLKRLKKTLPLMTLIGLMTADKAANGK